MSENLKNSRRKFLAEHPNFIEEMKSKNPNYGKHKVSVETKKHLSKINKGANNPSFGKHWFKNPNTTESKMFFNGEQPEGWVKGRHISENKKRLTAKKLKGRHWIHNISSNENKMLPKDQAAKLVESGAWEFGHTQKPISEEGLTNIRACKS